MAGQRWVADSTRYVTPRSKKSGDAWAEDAAQQQRRGTQRIVEVAEVQPPAEVAEALGQAEGEPAVVRRRVMYLNERPVELTESYYRVTLARGTRLADPRKIPGGAPTLLAELGARAQEISERVTVDLPDERVRELLELPAGEPVMILTRISRASDGTPVEVGVMTMTRGANLNYRMQVD